jgi:hypothetical protein
MIRTKQQKGNVIKFDRSNKKKKTSGLTIKQRLITVVTNTFNSKAWIDKTQLFSTKTIKHQEEKSQNLSLVSLQQFLSIVAFPP